MRLSCYKTWLLFVIALAMGGKSAFAQHEATPPLGPFGPSNVRYDLDLFAPPDLSTYADWPRPKEGFFFQYDRLYWAISGPKRTPIGAPGSAVGYTTDTGVNAFNEDGTPTDPSLLLTHYSSTADTGFIQADQTWGNRYELGFMEDNKGWLVSIMNLQNQTQGYRAGIFSDATTGTTVGVAAGQFIKFRDPQHLLLGFVDTNGDGFDDDLNLTPVAGGDIIGVFGRPKQIGGTGPVNLDTNNDGIPDAFAGFTDFGDRVPLTAIFNSITVVNQTSMTGTEITRDWRYPTTSYGIWDMMFGVRWLLLRDRFSVDAVANPTLQDGSTPAPLVTNPIALPGTSFWDSTVDNNMVGPQIGFRYDRNVARWNILTEFRFMAAVNFQSTHLDGELGSDLSNGQSQPPQLDRTNIPQNMERTYFRTWKYDETFSPVGELRVGVNYTLTKAIGIQAGYNAILGGGISRASRRIDYVLPSLEINNSAKNDSFFTDGISLGITCNR
jgi:hypothetical protein